MKKSLLLLVALMSVFGARAMELPEIFSDNMMLQQQTQARIWGWAKAGSTVTVSTSWDQQSYTSTAEGQSGRWEVTVLTPAASYDAHTVTIAADGETRTIRNVLIGEVWFCSGQSNMEMPMRGFWNCPVEGANDAIALSGKYRKSIRCVTVARQDPQEPADRVGGRWEVCEPRTVPGFSAVAYFFATRLTEMLDVPVGIIVCAWGGSTVEGWLPKEILLTYPDGLTPITQTDYHRKMVMFNGMLSPLAGYTIRGFLWNQGESNVGREQEYIDRFCTMVNLWRKMWRQPESPLPIYCVELPPYDYGPKDGTSGADFRAAQHKIKEVLSHYGCISTSDLAYEYEPSQIHATKKREIGERLAHMAAVRDYGIEGVIADCPEYEFHTVTDGAWNIYFTNTPDGFDHLADIDGFEAQDQDGTWHKAVVWAASEWQNVPRQGCFLRLTCPEAKEIKNVRYCYHNFIIGKLHNSRGLPLVPFTTEK